MKTQTEKVEHQNVFKLTINFKRQLDTRLNSLYHLRTVRIVFLAKVLRVFKTPLSPSVNQESSTSIPRGVTSRLLLWTRIKEDPTCPLFSKASKTRIVISDTPITGRKNPEPTLSYRFADVAERFGSAKRESFACILCCCGSFGICQLSTSLIEGTRKIHLPYNSPTCLLARHAPR